MISNINPAERMNPMPSIRTDLANEARQLHRDPGLRGVTLVVSPYAIGGDTGGLLGIIGPLRMDYAKIIPGLQFIAALLGRMLTQGLEE